MRAQVTYWQVRDELPKVPGEDIFGTILSLVLAGLAQRAPRPCGCPACRPAAAGS